MWQACGCGWEVWSCRHRNVAGMCFGQMLRGCGQNVVGMWLGCGRDVAWVWAVTGMWYYYHIPATVLPHNIPATSYIFASSMVHIPTTSATSLHLPSHICATPLPHPSVATDLMYIQSQTIPKSSAWANIQSLSGQPWPVWARCSRVYSTLTLHSGLRHNWTYTMPWYATPRLTPF